MTAADLMASFAERTGLTGTNPQKRYLWTDAFAVCNFLGLGDEPRALALIDRVHHVLGRHRADDTRGGWISGLAGTDGEAHPTRGGLRIGKPLPERAVDDLADEELEWDRDGQYFHYLTKWMHALDQAARATANEKLATWARELADTAYRRFSVGRRMYWKMSIDLSRPLVASMGHHDPLDGYITCLQLVATSADGPDLREALAGFRAMVVPDTLATADPLGIGGLLVDAYRLEQLDRELALRDAILAAARVGLAHYVRQRELARPASHRLAFRELGLAIGLAAVEHVPSFSELAHEREPILSFWTTAEHRDTRTYREHQDINDVMLATALAPRGFVVLGAR
jgi:hypothetical protein